MNVLKSIIRELDQHFKVYTFSVNRQFFKLQKYLKCTCEYTTTFLPIKIVVLLVCLSGVIFNLVSSLTNEWTPPLRILT